MKKYALLGALLCLSIVACSDNDSGTSAQANSDFVGTWIYLDSGFEKILRFTDDSVYADDYLHGCHLSEAVGTYSVKADALVMTGAYWAGRAYSPSSADSAEACQSEWDTYNLVYTASNALQNFTASSFELQHSTIHVSSSGMDTTYVWELYNKQ